MTIDSRRQLAFTSVWSHVISPCGQFIVCGTNMGRLLVFAIHPEFIQSNYSGEPIQSISLGLSCGWLTLCTSQGLLFCGVANRIWCFAWTKARDCPLQLTCEFSPFTNETTHITKLAFNGELNQLNLSTSLGEVLVYDEQLNRSTSFKVDQSTIHDLAVIAPTEVVTCTESGFVRFWDTRQDCRHPSDTFEPSKQTQLARPKLGEWLTTVSLDQADSDWFVTGGGPRLSLWNRRARALLCPLVSEDTGDSWYPQTSLFCVPNNEPRIMSGGSSGTLYQWDHSGSLLGSLLLSEPVTARLGHLVVVDCFAVPSLRMEMDESSNTHDIVLAAGCGPVMRLVSPTGYALGVLNLK